MSQVQINTLIRCPYCHDSIMERGPRVGCSECLAWHHTACLAELGRCGGCGAATPAPAAPSLAAERVRLNALLATSCAYQSCSSIDTISVGSVYYCRKHARQMGRGAMSSAVLMILFPLVMGGVFLGQGPGNGDSLLLLVMMTAVFGLVSGICLRRSKVLRLALAEAGAEAVAGVVAESVAEASARADRPKALLPKVARRRKKLSA